MGRVSVRGVQPPPQRRASGFLGGARGLWATLCMVFSRYSKENTMIIYEVALLSACLVVGQIYNRALGD